ncbi:MAG: RAMP superfamily CRISPR-associated protein [Methylococcales bacterium]
MTHFLNHYTLKYTPLSPVNIGADESYEPGNYVIDEEAGALYSFDSRAALIGLSDSERQQLLGIVNGKPDDTMLTKVQAFFHNHREKLLAYAMPAVPIASGVKSLYEKRIGKTAQNESQGRRVINKLEIERTFYNPVDGNPLLPGSSIKGAIRTALLDGINQKEKPLIERNIRNQQLQQLLFEGKFHTDPMRLVSIGDAGWHGKANKPACQVQFAVNRKRKPVFKDGKLVPSQAEASNLYQLLECVTPHHYQSFIGSLTLHNTQSVGQNNPKLPKQQLHWTAKDIAKACNDFYVWLFWQEFNAIKELGYLKSDWLNQMEQLLDNGLSMRLHNGDAFLLRVGRHSGGEALTLNGLRSIMIKGKGKEKTWEKQPKTWWLAADDISNKQGLLPFGWVLVEIDPKEPDNQLQQWLENDNNDLTSWMQQQSSKQNTLKQQAELRQEQEQLKRQAELQQVEELRLKQEAEQQRLASLSPVDQEIEAFLKPIQVADHDTRLLQELEKGRWESADAKIVAQKVKVLMEQAGKWMPDFAGSNDKKVKLKERSQKVLKYLQD